MREHNRREYYNTIRGAQRRRVVRMQKISLVSLFLFSIMIVSILTILSSNEVKASSDNKKFFTTIEVQDGDTLWTIAEEYMTEEYDSVQDYIDEVKDMNNLGSDMITSGCYVLIPYYAEEPIMQ